MRRGMLAAALLAGAACGGGNDYVPPATVNGTINGQGMGAQDAISNVLTAGTDSAGVIFITNAVDTCRKVSGRQVPRNGKAILVLLGFQTSSSTTAPAAAGVYPVFSAAAVGGQNNRNVAVARYQAVDAACFPNADLEATGGAVTLTKVDANGYAGTLDMTFEDNSHVTGTFTASKCDGLTQNLTGNCI